MLVRLMSPHRARDSRELKRRDKQQYIHIVCRLVYARAHDTIRYDTIEEINVDSKAEYTA